jgi:hypothetical protein
MGFHLPRTPITNADLPTTEPAVKQKASLIIWHDGVVTARNSLKVRYIAMMPLRHQTGGQ